jgi:hypothetical protein
MLIKFTLAVTERIHRVRETLQALADRIRVDMEFISNAFQTANGIGRELHLASERGNVGALINETFQPFDQRRDSADRREARHADCVDRRRDRRLADIGDLLELIVDQPPVFAKLFRFRLAALADAAQRHLDLA